MEEKFLLILLDLSHYLSILSSTKQVDLTENDEEIIQMSIQELCAADGMAVAGFIQHLQMNKQDAENTATGKEWHCTVQSMTDQHGMTLECMNQEKYLHCLTDYSREDTLSLHKY